ncbi:DJ-1/PfpI family protein [Massilia sp. CF038]|uniref:DJ-1/PfpI family protein n=1 Tax=Massilia sp. CF038 TaxID=1881045 RepID=UPI0009199A0A|nr:DJ-1/PfpI family protein [Massilia sp. CF038]SHH18936.1 DJ-1/PfpI family protein [Massilia sp. CF038]
MHLIKTLFLLLLLASGASRAQGIAPYEARLGRARPVVAVVGVNSGTELSDFLAPYAILARAGSMDVLALGTSAGPIQMRPALRVAPHATLAAFDAQYPDGADYIVVPAVAAPDDPVLLPWLAVQAAKGATIVSICDGALVVARAGIFKQHRATGHWATHRQRVADYPDTAWLANRRYVADGKVVSSAGISAAIPTALALVEAVAGRARADEVAAEIGASGWSDQHNSARFGRTPGMLLTALGNKLLHGQARIAIALHDGMDELEMALQADAFSRTLRSKAYGVADSMAPVMTRHGLQIYPDLDRSAAAGTVPVAGGNLKQIISQIRTMYGAGTAHLVAAQLEYDELAEANF